MNFKFPIAESVVSSGKSDCRKDKMLEDGNQLRNIGFCRKKTFSAVCWEWIWKEDKPGMERLNEEANQEESRSGKREAGRDGEKVDECV